MPFSAKPQEARRLIVIINCDVLAERTGPGHSGVTQGQDRPEARCKVDTGGFSCSGRGVGGGKGGGRGGGGGRSVGVDSLEYNCI